MGITRRARVVALALLAAVAGSASVGVAAFARAGICLHRLGLFGLHDRPSPPAMAMDGMAMSMPMDGMAMPSDGPCPVLVAAAIVAAALYVAAILCIVALRPTASEVALTSARIILALRFGPLAGLLAVISAVPLGAAIVMDGSVGPVQLLIAGVFLAVAAALSAMALGALANVVLAFACRLVVAIVAALRLLAPNPQPPWLLVHEPLLVHAGVALARRRPSRAPPVGV